MPHGEISLQEPPVLAEVQPAGAGRNALLVVPMMVMSLVFMASFITPFLRRAAANAGLALTGPRVLLLLGLLGGAMLAVTAAPMLAGGGQRRHKIAGDRRDYLRYLAQTRKQVRRYGDQQRQALAWRHPDPSSLWSLVMTGRLWERRPAHPDFGELRVGTGPQRLAVQISPLQTRAVEDLEPVAAKALRRFIRAYTTIPDQPVGLFVRGFGHVRFGGEPDVVRGVVRAVLAQLFALHAPDEVRIAVCASASRAPDWDWTKWLPHAQHGTDRDAAGGLRLFGDSIEALERLLTDEFSGRPRFDAAATPARDEPLVVIVCDGGRIPPGARLLASGYRNAVLFSLDGPAAAGPESLTLEITASDMVMVQKDRVGQDRRTWIARPDTLSGPRVETLARLASPYRLGGAGPEPSEDALSVDRDLPSLLGIADIEHFDAREVWTDRDAADRLRVPIGVAADGSPIVLDIKESAEGGMGPHGMLIGATGSGKSELLRTLVVALATTHSSATLNFVLVDFKGGATFAGLDQLPHVSATITNLADEVLLVDRMRDAISGELVRRQEVLRRAGNFSSVRDYEQARRAGTSLEPLPTLFVVVDEFSELIAGHPDFIELFVMIGRLGRSLAVHLLLASQRLDDGRIHQLESHLSYRVGLRTFSATESRAVIGVPDAYELPSAPGNGYLRSDVATITRFKAAYVSGPHRRRSHRVRPELIQAQVSLYRAENLAPDPDARPGQAVHEGGKPPVTTDPATMDPATSDPATGDPATTDTGAVPSSSVMEVMVEQLAGKGPPAHRVWLPPLLRAPTLDSLLPPLLPDPELGLRPLIRDPGPRLTVPLGVIDKPFEQMRGLLVADLSGAGGHLGVAGGPQSGKSTLLLSLITGLALTHSPREVQFYCLDFGGGALASIADLPHVGGVADRHDADRVNRTIAEMTGLLDQREQRFAAHGIQGMAAYRALRARHAAAGTTFDDPFDDQFGDVFVVVDGWFTLRQNFEAGEAALRDLAGRGLNYGIHLVLSTGRWSEVHHGMRDKIGTKLELRLGDPVESCINLRAAASVPRQPGRGLTEETLHFIAALPRIDGSGDTADLADAVLDLVDAVRECWSGTAARGVRMLPALLPAAHLPPADVTGPGSGIRVPIGVDESALAPVQHDFGAVPHLTALGDDASGKSNLLRLVARAVTGCFTSGQARIMVVDYRRSLMDVVPPEHLLGYAMAPDAARALAVDAAAGLATRMPGPDITPEQLRNRDWWTGPELFVLVDDYDLVAGHDNPLAPLMPYLPQATDVGLHVVLTRAAGGVMRLSMDPFLRRLQEISTPDLALSCPPGEGPLLGGVKPRHLPVGRAILCTRRGSRVIQTALSPAPVPAPA